MTEDRRVQSAPLRWYRTPVLACALAGVCSSPVPGSCWAGRM